MSLFGSPIVIASQLPDLAPGTTPIALGDFRSAYTIVTRSGTTVTVDNVTSFCSVFRFESRVGGAPTCSNAIRLLRIVMSEPVSLFGEVDHAADAAREQPGAAGGARG